MRPSWLAIRESLVSSRCVPIIRYARSHEGPPRKETLVVAFAHRASTVQDNTRSKLLSVLGSTTIAPIELFPKSVSRSSTQVKSGVVSLRKDTLSHEFEAKLSLPRATRGNIPIPWSRRGNCSVVLMALALHCTKVTG